MDETTNYMPSFISDRPQMDIDLDQDSVLIKHNGSEYLIGGLAKKHSPNAERTFGGHFGTPSYQRLVMALMAKTLGEGEHNTSIAMCASHDWIGSFRDSPRATQLKQDQEKLFRKIISEIQFKDIATDSEWKVCKVNPTEPTQVYHELQSVFYAIPSNLKSYILWQLGHGDFQQGVIVDGVPMVKAFHREKGISGAVEKLSQELDDLSIAYAEKAFRTNRMPEPGGMNGKEVDCTDEKRNACRKYFSDVIGRFLNKAHQYKDRAKNIVLSGGGAKDKELVDVLKKEVEGFGYKLHVISDLPLETKPKDCADPVMTTVAGMINKAPVAIDAGNNHLKSKQRIL